MISVLSMSFVLVNNSSNSNNTQISTVNCNDDAKAYIQDVKYNLDRGTIDVMVSVKGGDFGTSYRIKVTPKNQITGVVVEGALYCTVNRKNAGYKTVTFHCYSGKESDAPYCRAYTFNVEIVD